MEDRTEWLKGRKRGIGGSEVAPILGLSPFKTAYQVWEDKVGLSTGGQEDTPQMAYGRLVEPVLRQWYSNETGRPVIVPKLLVHPKHDFIIGSLDGVTPDNRVIEIKTARSEKDWGEPGTDQVPTYYRLQIEHYMMITGFVVADVVVSFSGSIPEIYEVHADQELQEMLIEEESRFWDGVINRIPPEPVSLADVLSMFGKTSKATTITSNPEIEMCLDRLREIKTSIKELEEAEKINGAAVLKFMAENEVLADLEGRLLATWKKAKDSEVFDAKAFAAQCPKTYKRFFKTQTGSRRFLLKGIK